MSKTRNPPEAGVCLTLPAALASALVRLRDGGWDASRPAVVVDGGSQRLWLVEEEGGAPLASWAVSTGAAGFGCVADSGCTPTGLHRIAACFGADAPLGAVFKAREFTGRIIPPGEDPGPGDFITTRILWLEGLEPGVNAGAGVDSRERYIYIHGTPRVDRLGTPASAGCVRMADAAIADLFQRVGEGTLVLLLG
ncbi:MAG: L,D-transpeptidase [Magnetococcales bacterium]|nr:L,D-transpeptidase [Magnetococcales bacterium]